MQVNFATWWTSIHKSAPHDLYYDDDCWWLIDDVCDAAAAAAAADDDDDDDDDDADDYEDAMLESDNNQIKFLPSKHSPYTQHLQVSASTK